MIFIRKILFHVSLLRRTFFLVQIIREKILNKKLPKFNSKILDNDVYGTYQILKVLGLTDDHYIEHGVFFGEHTQKDQFLYGKKFITMSNHRGKILERKGANKVVAVGPYLQYINIKNLFGLQELHSKKNLLIFPPHSSNNFESKYKMSEIRQICTNLHSKYHFDNLLVCWYYLDYNPDFNVPNVNVLNLTCNSKWDPTFLNRFKELVDLATYSLSFNVGTHIGYSVSMNVPHTIMDIGWHQKTIKPLSNIDRKNKNSVNRRNEINQVKKEFIKNEHSLHIRINDNQKNIIEKYWGKWNSQ